MPGIAGSFERLADAPRMPALFVGHGSPMNAIEDNDYSRSWRRMGAALPPPAAILCISAHWLTAGTSKVNVLEHPRTIHDFSGFPSELYAQNYPAPGAPNVARATADLVDIHAIEPDLEWGLDHGAWSFLLHMYPGANIPVFQLSLDYSKSLRSHFDLAKQLKRMRDKGVLIIGSGNLVHNLGTMTSNAKPFEWALEFDDLIAMAVLNRNYEALVEVQSLEPLTRLAHPTLEHFLPVLYTVGVADEKDELTFFNEAFELGSISMRSFILK